jgi:hypothetical protein
MLKLKPLLRPPRCGAGAGLSPPVRCGVASKAPPPPRPGPKAREGLAQQPVPAGGFGQAHLGPRADLGDDFGGGQAAEASGGEEV